VRLERLMSFARFLVAFDMGQEANGVLDVALSEAPSLEHDESYLVVRAAALTMADRHEEALAIIDSYLMDGVVDAQIWGLISNAALRNWSAVNTAYDEVAALFDSYPPALVSRARLDGIEAALNVQAIDLAVDRLSQVDTARLANGPLQGRLDLLQARLDLSKGRVEAALEAFDRIRDSNTGAIGAEATLRGVTARIENDVVTLEEGLDQLENLAVAWRGDDTEVRTRELLGDLYVQQGRYSEALTALKGILIAQPDHPTANDVSDEMQSIFVDLFLNGEADRLPAIDALSLFYDFRELTPIGRRGDELVRRLADRLVSIDLLDQAADLLEHQVENRLTGAAKAQVAADLALIYLMDFRPSEAVAVLQRTRISQVPMSIERGRRVIEARALSELGRDELALEMLRGLEGTDVSDVRADILWNAERWLEAGEVLERQLGDRWNDRVPLDEDEMQQVLRTAIAFSFAGDEYALERLRARFDAKMSDGIYASAFDVVTAPIEAQGTAFRDVARSIAGLNTLSRFLADYRSRFSGQTLSDTPPDA
jgi:tetratricopeptide (TPR) repeat protein